MTRTPGRVPDTAFIPARHRWMVTLRGELRRLGLEVQEMVLADGRLRVLLGLPGGETMALVARPRAAGQPGWAETRTLTLGFEGSRHPGPGQRAALAAVHALLERLSTRIPPDLEGVAAVVPGDLPPEERLRRLFPFVDVERSSDGREGCVEVLLRGTPRCNQACPFCSAPDHGEPPGEALLAAAAAAGRLLPGAILTLTGGEPTLRTGFREELQRILALPGPARVQVQTNAVRFASHRDPAELPPSPRLLFFVSLHAVEAEIYDLCTGTRGQLPGALEGIRRLLDAGHAVTLNTVVSALNLAHLDAMAGSLPGLFPPPRRPQHHVSVLICPEGRPGAAENLVRYSDLVPAVRRIEAALSAAGFATDSLLASTHASLPPCLLGASPAPGERRAVVAGLHETGYETPGTPWVKAAGCRGCAEAGGCLGVPAPYAARFGLEELVPLPGQDRS
ncbi:MAG: radical SAM protein [Deltaproteobacteria bacterium]|nr:radical SAM protein [Deltaproteobacteria bacterium]